MHIQNSAVSSPVERVDNPTVLEFKRCCDDVDWPLPSYGSEWASGLDLSAAVDTTITMAPGEIKLIPTGWAVAVPHGYEGQVRPRSGVAFKKGLTIINTPGTVDSDYRGEIFMAMVNLGSIPQEIKRGDRLAQLVIIKVERPQVKVMEVLSETIRGEGGFGSTGF
ncbi:MAG: dUTP diphosphatase [Deltaproteobacteria bacterium]|jgi:dUTP pyrophosphatase|nr:dUTP diphosphatase [Deltaproteobacteria bacterium]